MQKLLHGDCLELMKEISDNSIDLVLVDPPFQKTQNKWDTMIDPAKMWEQYKRITKQNAAIVIFCMQPFTSILVSSNLSMFKYDWVWRKPKGTGHLNAKKQPMRDKEDILVFYEKQCTYNPQMTSGTPYKNKAGKDHTAITSMSDNYGNYTNFRNENTGFRYPKQVIDFPVVERNLHHPNEKPLILLEYLIKTYSNEGDLILDNCMGSGTTCLGAKNLNRKFIGIEKNKEYFEIAQKRIL